MTRSITRLALGIIVSLAAVSPSHADDKTWFAGASGDFGNPNFWISPGVPGPGDTATFDSIGTYTVTFDRPPFPFPPLPSPVVNRDLFFKAGTVTFTSGTNLPYTYSLAGAGGDDALITGGTLTLGSQPGRRLDMTVGDDLRIRGGATMFAKFGSQITTRDLILGSSTAPAGDGTLTIDGGVNLGTKLTVNDSAEVGTGGKTGNLTVRNGATAVFNGTLTLGVGANSTGNLVVSSGGEIITANIRIGPDAVTGQTGTMLVGNGGGISKVTQFVTATLVVGASGGPTANIDSLTIALGGEFNSGGAGTITVNPTGQINVDFEGMLNAQGNVTINGGLLRSRQSIDLTFGDPTGGTFLSPSKTMTIQNGGRFEVTGTQYNADATYKVTGTDSTWTHTGPLYVGIIGTGSLTIEGGGEVHSNTSNNPDNADNAFAEIGFLADSVGTVTVTGDGSTWTVGSADMVVGHFGHATLAIEDGGEVYSNGGNPLTNATHIGFRAGSVGAVTVTGDGSTWTVGSDLDVGFEGHATLRIEDGGEVYSNSGTVRTRTGSAGGVTVTGAGSKWTNSEVLSVGSNPPDPVGTVLGSGRLTIEDGGAVSNTYGYVAASGGSDGGVTVTGAGSKWTNSGALSVGDWGTGRLTIEDGGAVSNTIGDIGNVSSGSSRGDGTVTVTGADSVTRAVSTWTNSSELSVGGQGTGRLTISAGGKVSNTSGNVGFGAGSDGTVTVTGVDSQTGAFSTWTNSSELYVGRASTGRLTIDDGGKVFNTIGAVGKYSSGDGHVHVAGDDSTWTNSGALSVGDIGTGTLEIAAGGKVSNTSGRVGLEAGGVGIVKVTGVGSRTGAFSTWTNSSELYVGGLGTGTLEITKGGKVFNTIGSLGRFTNGLSSGDGHVDVADDDSTWTNSHALIVGDVGTGTLEIARGGKVSNTSGIVGLFGDGTVTVTGVGSLPGTFSTWTNSEKLWVGGTGTGELEIKNGGKVFSKESVIGAVLGSDGTVTVSGGDAGSTWANDGELIVGEWGTGRLTIEDGGRVSNTSARVGNFHFYAGFGFVTVTGSGSKWNNDGALYVGGDEVGAGTGTLNVQSAGAVSSTTGYVGAFAGSVGTVTVTGAVAGTGSTWTTSTLNVGGTPTQSGGTGTLTVSAGGLVQANGNAFVWDNGAIDVQAAGTLNANGNVMVNGGALTRASAGAFNLSAGKTMTIQNGGMASFSGSYFTASNAMYSVTGANSMTGVGSRFEALAGGTLWIINGATINVSSGASLFGATTIHVGFGFSDGTDGTLIVDGPDSSATTPGTGASVWGHAGSTATVRFQNDASGSFSQVSLAHSTIAGTTGIVTVESGAHLTFTNNLFLAALGGATTSASLSVQGSGLSGSTVTQTGGSSLTVGHDSTGTAIIDIGTASSGAVFDTGTGAMTINKTGTVTIGSASTTGTLKADGNVTVDGGKLKVFSGSNVIVAGDKTMTLIHGGTLAGAGTVTIIPSNLINDGGVIDPGDSPGALTINGNYTQLSAGVLKLEVAGTQPGSFDQLVVTGNASIQGQVVLAMIDNFLPQAGDQFDLLHVSGTFSDTADVSVTGVAEGWQYSQSFDPITGMLVLTSLNDAHLIGDFNLDGSVDAADYIVWRKGLGTIYTPDDLNDWRAHFGDTSLNDAQLVGDFNLDGSVDAGDYVVWRKGLGTIFTQNDFNIWRANFGNIASGSGSAIGPPSQTEVPEPAALILWGLAMTCLALVVRRCSERKCIRLQPAPGGACATPSQTLLRTFS